MYALLLTQDPDEKAVLSVTLQRVGLAVTTANDLDRALRAWADRPVDLIFLAFREHDPLDAVRRIRARTSVPLVAIVTQPNEDLHYQLLEAGADQVVSRPFSARLLIAQARALLRRARGTPVFSLPTLTQGDIVLDPATRIAHVAGQSSKRLTHLEFRLLYTLMMHRNQVLPTETIVEQVWGYSERGDKELVRGLVRRLRAKVEPDRHDPRYILTVPGVGYSFQPTEKL
jgi:DNA-binding response OmpR family regulator